VPGGLSSGPRRPILNPPPNAAAHFVDIVEHATAFAKAELRVEEQLRRFPRDEICIVIAEDTDRVKRALKRGHALLRNPEEAAGNPIFAKVPLMPMRKVVDTPHFAAKGESVPLQIADTCAFLILRRLMRRGDSQPFFEAIAPQILSDVSEFGDPMGAEQFGVGPRI
jgi:hypothetical protein